MKFFTTAGFAIPGIAALSSAGDVAPRMQPASMRSSGASHEAALQRISATVRESAITRHQLDFERTGRRSEALSSLKGTIVDLKSRMERKSGGHSHMALIDAGFKVSALAS